MTSISGISGQSHVHVAQQSQAAARPMDSDGDHDNGAPDAKSTAPATNSSRALDVIA